MINEEKPIDEMAQGSPSDGVENTLPTDVNEPKADAAQSGANPSEASAEAEQETTGMSDPQGVEAIPVEDAEILSEAASDAANQKIIALSQEISTLREQVEDRTTQFMRIAADFDNFRKRTQKEREEMELQIKCNTVIELLPVVDNFERARSQIKPQGEEGIAIHKSYQGVYKDLVDRLKRLGVAQMRCEGQDFDPNYHEAVMRQASADHDEGTVIEELVRGYTLGERVLRHAMVKVAAPPEEDDSASTEASNSDASEE
ncbi:MAG: nucleotide exchange factor GrpE [Cyanobacteria bacterium J06638_22]